MQSEKERRTRRQRRNWQLLISCAHDYVSGWEQYILFLHYTLTHWRNSALSLLNAVSCNMWTLFSCSFFHSL